MPTEITGPSLRPEPPAATLPPGTMIPVLLPLAHWPMVVEAIRDYYPAPRGRTEDLWQRLTSQIDHQVQQCLEAQAEARKPAGDAA